MTLPATSNWIGVTTLSGHVARAVDFQAKTNVWISMGKPTAWSSGSDPTISDTNPPVPDPTSTTLTEPVLAAQATLSLVIPCADGTANSFKVYGKSWLAITPSTAQTNGCRNVLVEADFAYNAAPIGSYDSYTTQDAAIGATTLYLGNAGGYQVGDTIQLGYNGQTTTVKTVDPVGNTITTNDVLTALVYAGTFITVTSNASPFQFRQLGIIGDVVATGQAGQSPKPISMLTSYSVQYLYNSAPIPRSLGREDTPKIVLTF